MEGELFILVIEITPNTIKGHKHNSSLARFKATIGDVIGVFTQITEFNIQINLTIYQGIFSRNRCH